MLGSRSSKRERSLIIDPASPSLHPRHRPVRPVRSSRSSTPERPGHSEPVFAARGHLVELHRRAPRPSAESSPKGSEVESREAFEALPESSRRRSSIQKSQSGIALFAEHTRKTATRLSRFRSWRSSMDWNARAKLTLSRAGRLAQTAEHVGLVIEPDARLTDRPYGWEDVVSLLRRERERAFRPTRRYLAAVADARAWKFTSPRLMAASTTSKSIRWHGFSNPSFCSSRPRLRRLEASNASS